MLPAHLESNFINPEYRGAQPLECLRLPTNARTDGDFSGAEILSEIHAASGDVGIMTIAPEIDGAIDLIRQLAAQGIYISLGHSGATVRTGAGRASTLAPGMRRIFSIG